MCSDHIGGSSLLRVAGNTLARKSRNFGRSWQRMSRPWPVPCRSASEPSTATQYAGAIRAKRRTRVARRAPARAPAARRGDPRPREQEARQHEEQHDRDPQLADRAVEQVRAPGPGSSRRCTSRRAGPRRPARRGRAFHPVRGDGGEKSGSRPTVQVMSDRPQQLLEAPRRAGRALPRAPARGDQRPRRRPRARAVRAAHRLGQVRRLLPRHHAAARARRRPGADRLAAAGADAQPDRGGRAARASARTRSTRPTATAGTRSARCWSETPSTCC